MKLTLPEIIERQVKKHFSSKSRSKANEKLV